MAGNYLGSDGASLKAQHCTTQPSTAHYESSWVLQQIESHTTGLWHQREGDRHYVSWQTGVERRFSLRFSSSPQFPLHLSPLCMYVTHTSYECPWALHSGKYRALFSPIIVSDKLGFPREKLQWDLKMLESLQFRVKHKAYFESAKVGKKSDAPHPVWDAVKKLKQKNNTNNTTMEELSSISSAWIKSHNATVEYTALCISYLMWNLLLNQNVK